MPRQVTGLGKALATGHAQTGLLACVRPDKHSQGAGDGKALATGRTHAELLARACEHASPSRRARQVRACTVKALGSAKPLPQVTHVWGSSLVWVQATLVELLAIAKPLPHIVHTKGFLACMGSGMRRQGAAHGEALATGRAYRGFFLSVGVGMHSQDASLCKALGHRTRIGLARVRPAMRCQGAGPGQSPCHRSRTHKRSDCQCRSGQPHQKCRPWQSPCPHLALTTGFLPVWVWACLVKVLTSAKPLPQVTHTRKPSRSCGPPAHAFSQIAGRGTVLSALRAHVRPCSFLHRMGWLAAQTVTQVSWPAAFDALLEHTGLVQSTQPRRLKREQEHRDRAPRVSSRICCSQPR